MDDATLTRCTEIHFRMSDLAEWLANEELPRSERDAMMKELDELRAEFRDLWEME